MPNGNTDDVSITVAWARERLDEARDRLRAGDLLQAAMNG